MMSPVTLPVSRLSGYAPALPTPFDDDDAVDLSALAYLCDRQIRQGANALVLFREANPTPVKYALSLLGVMSSRVRLPLVEPADNTKDEISAVLADVCEGYIDYMVGQPAAGNHADQAATSASSSQITRLRPWRLAAVRQ